MSIIRNLKEVLLQALEDIERLEEQADPRRQIISQIRELAPNIVLHLYKIYGFGDTNPTTVHHWATEISANLRSFCNTKVKATKKTLSTDEIMRVFKEKYMDASELASIESALVLEYGYSELDNVVLYDKIYNVLPKILNYMKSISDRQRPDIDKLMEIIREE